MEKRTRKVAFFPEERRKIGSFFEVVCVFANFGTDLLFFTYHELDENSEKIFYQILLIFIFFENSLGNFVDPLENFFLFEHIAVY